MPINAYSGDVGSGKTYSVVLHVIIPAIMAGRSICTNIAGLDIEAIYAYCLTIAKPDKIFCFGVIRFLDRADPEQENFFPYDDSLPPEDFNVQPGELVIIDEASRYWAMGEKLFKNHAMFINEHRHFINAQGHTCDLVVIDPDVTELHRRLKSKIETTYYTKKLKEVGMTNKYIVLLYRKTSMRREYDRLGPLTYQKEVYSLYHSYKGGSGTEQTVDKRQNILSNKKLWYRIGALIAFVLIFGIGGIYQLSKFFGRGKKPQTSITQGEKGVSSGAVVSGQKPAPSSVWHVVGKYMKKGYPVFILADNSGNYRYFSPVPVVQPDSVVQITVDGEKINSWSFVQAKGVLP